MSSGASQANKHPMIDAVVEVIRVATPLMVSTATFSLVLFADRTFLLRYDGASMSASMAAGNLFWVLVCLPVGIVSMTGAIIGQYIGASEQDRIGRFLWQSVWMTFAFVPLFALVAWKAPWIFRACGQPESLLKMEVIYLRLLLIGAVGNVLETALSGFFSGTERTSVIMWVSLASGLFNVVFDLILIFGAGPVPAMGIAGAAIASAMAFWFKAVCYGALLWRHGGESYRLISGFGLDMPMLRNLFFFGFPTGLMYLTESGGFTIMMLRIGTLGDIPLRATTMAINFNMVAFIPLVGVSIAASVLVGRHLLESGAVRATQCVYAALGVGLIYSSLWCFAFLFLPDVMMALYTQTASDQDSLRAIAIAQGLLRFVAIYVMLDSLQLILAGALRGAGDTWFVLLGGLITSALTLLIGFTWEPNSDAGVNSILYWWWSMIALWVWMLGTTMGIRFMQGRWKKMRMV